MHRNFDEIRAAFAFAFCALSLRLLAWEVPASRGREQSSGDPWPDDASLSSDPITSSEWSYTADRMMLPRCRKVARIRETFDCNSKEVENPKWIARRGGWGPDNFGDPPGGTAILVSDVQPVVAFGVDRLDVRAQATGAVSSAMIGCPDTAPLVTHSPASSAPRTKAVETPFSHSSLMLNTKPSIVSAFEREHRLCRI